MIDWLIDDAVPYLVESDAVFNLPQKSEIGAGNDITPQFVSFQFTSEKTSFIELATESDTSW